MHKPAQVELQLDRPQLPYLETLGPVIAGGIPAHCRRRQPNPTKKGPHIRMLPSFFFTNNTGAPQGQTLGLMKPLSSSSCSYSFNPLNLVGAIRYKALEIGLEPSNSSIEKFISLSGGNPDKSSGNTSGNSLTTGMSFGFNSPCCVSLTVARYPLHPFFIIRLAYKAEITRGEVYAPLPTKQNSISPGTWKITFFLRQSTMA